MKSEAGYKNKRSRFIKSIFLLSALNFAVTSAGEEISFEKSLPKGGEIKKEGNNTVLSLKSPETVSLASKDTAVEPNTLYQVKLEAKVNGSELDPNKNKYLPYWEIRIKDTENRLPHEGHLKYPWQKCFSTKWRTYQQSFYTPATGKKLQLIVSNGSGKNSIMIRNAVLKKVISQNILINSDFSGGEFDYSGWNELSKAKLVKDKGTVKLEIPAGGYALSDPVPVFPGKYTFSGMPLPELFFYDADMMRLNCKRIRSNTFSTPENAAYLRFFFVSGKIGKISLRHIKKEGK